METSKIYGVENDEFVVFWNGKDDPEVQRLLSRYDTIADLLAPKDAPQGESLAESQDKSFAESLAESYDTRVKQLVLYMASQL